MDLSAVDVQQKTFRERFRGYDPDDVEDFLDRVVETLRGYEVKLRQQQDDMEKLRNDVEGTKEAEEAIKRTYITAQRTSQEMVNEAQEKANRILDKAKVDAEASVKEAEEKSKQARADAAIEEEALQRRIAQLRTAVGDLQGRLATFAEEASVELEAIGASIDLETEELAEILDRGSDGDGSETQAGERPAGEKQADKSNSSSGPKDQAAEEAPKADTKVADEASDKQKKREAAYLQQPRGQRPWDAKKG